MRKIYAILLCLSLIAISACGNNNNEAGAEIKTTDAPAVQAQVVKKYPFKSGMITFQRTGVIGNNKIIVYFDDYGIKERRETYNENGELSEVKFSDGENMYTIPESAAGQNIVYIMGSGVNGTEMKFVPDPFINNEKRKEKYEYKELPNIEVAGKDCQAYSMKSAGGTTTFAGWQDLLLYSKVQISMGSMETVAVEVKENEAVDPALFKVPAGYKVEKI